MTTPYPYGPCECVTDCQCAINPGPALYLVSFLGNDDDKRKVCTRCVVSDDNPTLLAKGGDSMELFVRYDPFVLLGMSIESKLVHTDTISDGADFIDPDNPPAGCLEID